MQTVEQRENSMTDDGIVVPEESGQAGEENQNGSDAESRDAAKREWEELIASDRYHALYTAHVSEIVKKRLGESRQQGALLQRAAAMMAALPPDERASLPPVVDVTCHMCGRTFTVKTA